MIDISLKEPVILFADPADHRGDPDISAILLNCSCLSGYTIVLTCWSDTFYKLSLSWDSRK